METKKGWNISLFYWVSYLWKWGFFLFNNEETALFQYIQIFELHI